MIEAYKIGASIILETNTNTVLGQMIGEFEKLNKIVIDARASVKGLGTEIRGLKGAEASIVSLARALDKINAAANGAAKATSGMAAKMPTMATDAQNIAAGFERAQKAAQAIVSAPRLLGYTPPPLPEQLRISGPGSAGGAMAPFYGYPSSGRGAHSWAGAGSGNWYGGGSSPPAGGGSGGPGMRFLGYGGGSDAPDEPFHKPELNLGHKTPSHGDFMMAGMGAASVGMAAADLVEHVFSSAEEIATERVKMRLLGFTEKQGQAAEDAAQHTQQTVPGSSMAGNMEIIRDFASLIQNPDEAISSVVGFAKMGQVLGLVGKGNQLAELFQSMQAGELRGAISNPTTGQIDTGKFGQFLKAVEDVTIKTNGRVGPKEYAAFLRQAGTAGVQMDDDMLFNKMPAVIIALRAARAGTAINSFRQMQNHIAPGYAKEQARLGLLDHGKMVGGDLAGSDLSEYVKTVLVPQMQAHGITDQKDQLNELYKLYQRSTVTRLMEDLIRNQPLIDIYSKSIGAARADDKDPYDTASKSNPKQAVEGLHAAWDAFLATLGKPSMGAATQSLKDITGALNFLADEAKDHPNAARYLIDVAVGLAAVGGAAGAVLLAIAPVMALMKVGKWTGLMTLLKAGVPGMPPVGPPVAGGPTALGGLSRIAAIGWLANAIAPYEQAAIDKAVELVTTKSFNDKMTTEKQFQQNYSPFDSSTWADPNNFFATDGPNRPGFADRNKSDGPTPVYVVNPEHIGQAVGNGLSSAATSQPTGPTGFDFRTSMPLQGVP